MIIDFNGNPDTKSHTRKLSMSVQLSDKIMMVVNIL